MHVTDRMVRKMADVLAKRVPLRNDKEAMKLARECCDALDLDAERVLQDRDARWDDPV